MLADASPSIDPLRRAEKERAGSVQHMNYTKHSMDSSFFILLILLALDSAQSAPVPRQSPGLKSGLGKKCEGGRLYVKPKMYFKGNASEIESLNVYMQITRANQYFMMPVHDGDILINRAGRAVLKCTSCFWIKSENGLVFVPYILSPNYTPTQVALFTNAMQEIASVTCVRFVQRTDEVAFLNITEKGGCASTIGRTGGAQDLFLNSSTCMSRGAIQHELQHSLGFFHEHVRSDRDDYVTIMTQYISPESLPNFAKVDSNNLDLPYDYSSVMQYPGNAFSNTPGKNTIIPKPIASVPIGQRNGLSTLDVAKINAIYQCDICAMLLPNVSGTVTSANYPAEYPNNNRCVWLIRVPTGQVTLKFNTFDVEDSSGCSADFIQIFDGPSMDSPVLVDRTCGNVLLPFMISSSNQVLIQFVTSETVAKTGFNITYGTVQCGGAFYAPAKNFTTPGYPNAYPPNMKCKWTIIAPLGYTISLKINNFQLEAPFYSSCIYDYLSIFDGPDTSALKVGQFCGSQYTSPIESTGNAMVVSFVSDSRYQYSGCNLSYRQMPIQTSN